MNFADNDGYNISADNGKKYYLGELTELSCNLSTDLIIIYEYVWQDNFETLHIINYMAGASFFEEETEEAFIDIIRYIEGV